MKDHATIIPDLHIRFIETGSEYADYGGMGQDGYFVVRLVDFVIRRRWWLFCTALALTALAWPFAQRLEFEGSIESLFAANDSYLRSYRESKELFGGHEQGVVAYSDPALFRGDADDRLTEAAAARLRHLAEKLRAVPGVHRDSVFHLEEALRANIRNSHVVRLLEGVLVGRDRHATAVVFTLQPPEEAGVPRSETVAEIRRIAEANDPPAYVIGESVVVSDMFRYVEADGHHLMWVSLGLLATVALVLFRGFRWLVMPILVVLAVSTWTRAVLAYLGIPLTMVSSILNSLILIIGVATVMHVIVQFRARYDALGRVEGIRQTLIDLHGPVFWSCATTAVGFAALLLSDIAPVRDLALMMALASMLVYVAMLALIPGAFLLGNREIAPPALKESAFLKGVGDWVWQHSSWVALGTAALLVVSGIGLARIRIESDTSKNFRSTAPVVEALDFVETRLGGSGNWEILLPAPTPLTKEYLARVRRLTDRLQGIGGQTITWQDTASEASPVESLRILSFTDTLDLVPEVPFVLNTIDKRVAALAKLQPRLVQSFYNPQAGLLRVLLRSPERLSAQEKMTLIERVERIAREEFRDARVTGLYVLFTYLVQNLLGNQWLSLSLAAAGITLLMAIAFRSVGLGLIALVPNVLPIALVLGALGWLGIPMNMGAAMIASVSVGLTVDGTIHYITDFQRLRRERLDPTQALRRTQQSVGLAMGFTTLALVVGFSSLAFSNFVPLIHFGVLTGFSMLSGLFAALVFLPLTLRWYLGASPGLRIGFGRLSPTRIAMPASIVHRRSGREELS